MRDKADNSPAGNAGQTPAASGGSSPPESVLGDFELRQVIGRGGMGTVYEARQRSLARPVALKVLAAHIAASPKAVQRFQREAQAAAKLHHTHIIPIFAQGEENGIYYYAMELIHGRGLNVLIAEARDLRTAGAADLADTVPLPRSRRGRSGEASDADDSAAPAGGTGTTVVTLGNTTVDVGSAEYFATVARHMASTADALEYAHGEGVIHRDIKPHNLILGDDGRLRIADFGLARVVEQPGVTMTGEMLGSPLYMSPEQITAGPTKVDYRTDIYSLGATMYEWLALQPPHPGETREAVVNSILSSDPLPLHAHNREIPVDLETICLKAIERNLGRRYRSAAELRDDLYRYLERRTIKASPVSLIERARKFVGRHQIASLAMTAAVVAAALGAALYYTQREVQTQTAAAVVAQEQAVEATQQTDHILDMLGTAFPLTGAAVESVVQTGEAVSSLTQNPQEAPGASAKAASMPEEIACRASRDMYETLVATELPATDEGDAYTVVLRTALEKRRTDPERALGHVDVYLQQRSDDFDALQLRAALHGQLKEYDKMADDAEQLVRLRVDNPIAYLWRGLARLLLDQTELCLADLRRAAESDATAAWAGALEGLALIRTDRSAEAIMTFNRVLDGSPDLVVAILGRAVAYMAAGDPNAAVNDLSRVIELEPDNADALAARGDHHVRLGDFDAAIQDFDRAMLIAGRTPAMVLRYLAVIAHRQQMQKPDTGEPEPEEQADEASKKRIEGWFHRWVYPRTSPEDG